MRRSALDVNDMHGGPESAVHINRWNDHDTPDLDAPERYPRPRTIRVFRNVLHHNAAKGYRKV